MGLVFSQGAESTHRVWRESSAKNVLASGRLCVRLYLDDHWGDGHDDAIPLGGHSFGRRGKKKITIRDFLMGKA